ncbi:small subunit ribosomal protein S21 [Pedobacter sp. UYP24]
MITKTNPYLCNPKNNERRYFNVMIIINIKDGESLDKALKRFKKKFEKTGVLRELRSRQAYEKKSVARRTQVKHAIYIQNMQLEGTI